MGQRLASATGLGLFWWAGAIMLFVLIPLIDLAIGTDAENPPDSLIEWLEQDRCYRWCTYLCLPLQYASLVLARWLRTSAELSITDEIGLAATVGVVAGIGIKTAHELGHKKDELERWLSKIALAQSSYGHFYIEHHRGHHGRGAAPRTRRAPGSSRPSGDSCRVRSSAASNPVGTWRRPTSPGRARAPGRCATRSSTPGA